MTAGRFLRHVTRAVTGTKVKFLVVSKLVGLLLLTPSAASQQSALKSPPLVSMESCVHSYSILSTRIGSVDAARRAGKIAAIAAAAKSNSTLPPTASGSATGVS